MSFFIFSSSAPFSLTAGNGGLTIDPNCCGHFECCQTKSKLYLIYVNSNESEIGAQEKHD